MKQDSKLVDDFKQYIGAMKDKLPDDSSGAWIFLRTPCFCNGEFKQNDREYVPAWRIATPPEYCQVGNSLLLVYDKGKGLSLLINQRMLDEIKQKRSVLGPSMGKYVEIKIDETLTQDEIIFSKEHEQEIRELVRLCTK